ncbi:MAG: carbonic anhydrase [Asticcacaulis sp.]
MDSLIEKNLKGVVQYARRDPLAAERRATAPVSSFVWIGCSDSPFPAHETLWLEPEGGLIHRNLGNQASAQDLGLYATFQMALTMMALPKIVVCGHYNCACMQTVVTQKSEGVLSHWLQPLYDLYRRHEPELIAIARTQDRANRLAELNVRAQLSALANNTLIREHWGRHKRLEIHGVVYSHRDGLLRDLGVTLNSLSSADALLSGMIRL